MAPITPPPSHHDNGGAAAASVVVAHQHPHHLAPHPQHHQHHQHHQQYEAVPRTYASSPSLTPPTPSLAPAGSSSSRSSSSRSSSRNIAGNSNAAELQPWMFQYSEPYAQQPPAFTAVVDSHHHQQQRYPHDHHHQHHHHPHQQQPQQQFVQQPAGDGLLYGQPMHPSSSSPSRSSSSSSSSAPSSRTPSIPAYGHSSLATDWSFYEPFDGSQHPFHELDSNTSASTRDTKRVRLSPPFSEYDSASSSSECDQRDWQASHSDYTRSPQPSASRSPPPRATPRSSPNMTTHSPNLGISHLHSSHGLGLPYLHPHQHVGSPFRGGVGGGDGGRGGSSVGPVRSKVRKVRRKLEPKEREQVHQLRKIGACTKCWGLKMKCDDGSPCKRCEKTGVGSQCVRVHFVDLDVFSKWLVDSYSRSMMHHTLHFANSLPRTVAICHEKALGATMQINVFEFIPETSEQLECWYKGAAGWLSTPTTPFAIKRGISTEILEKYVHAHTSYYIETAFGPGPGGAIMAEIFAAAFGYAAAAENVLVRDALHLWTAVQLLIRGPALHPSSDSLGMLPIPGQTAPLPPPPADQPGHAGQTCQTPLPRVLANQIDHLLERRVWQLEKQILSELQKRIFSRKREDWLKIFFATVVLMNALERDSWRLYYWTLHMDDGRPWQHPSPPKRLIEKNDALAESLAAHFAAISKGITPFALDWSREQTIGLIGGSSTRSSYCDDPQDMVDSIRRIGRALRNPDHALYTRNVFSHYRQDDERSLDFLYSSKVMIV